MQKETIAKRDAEVAKKNVKNAQLRADIARLRFKTPATGHPTQEIAPVPRQARVQERGHVPRTAAAGIALAGRTRRAAGGRLAAKAAAAAIRHGAACECALPQPHPLL